jgi:hypothetical protein
VIALSIKAISGALANMEISIFTTGSTRSEIFTSFAIKSTICSLLCVSTLRSREFKATINAELSS